MNRLLFIDYFLRLVHFGVDFTITAAQVTAPANTAFKQLIAGVTIAAGQVIYKDTLDSNKAKLADANLSDAASQAIGIAVNGASAGQPIDYLDTAGAELTLTTGSALGAVGLPVVLSAAVAGNMAPHTDLAAGHYPIILGFLGSTGKTLILVMKRSTLPHG